MTGIGARVISNALDADLAERVRSFVCGSKFSYGWKSVDGDGIPGHWSCNFFEFGSKEALPQVLDLACRQISSAVKAGRLKRCYANLHTFGVEGYPHVDSNNDGDITAVVFLSRPWDIMWGGEIQFFDGDTISMSVLPKFNTAVVFPGNVMHCARSVTRICTSPRITLMFKFEG